MMPIFARGRGWNTDLGLILKSLCLCVGVAGRAWAGEAATPAPVLTPDSVFTERMDIRLEAEGGGPDSIVYTVDGTLPEENKGWRADSGATVSVYTTTTVKAMHSPAEMPGSAVVSATYTRATAAKPILFMMQGEYFYGTAAVAIQCLTPGATIRYTTDGSTPSATNGITLSTNGTVALTSTCTLKAIAIKDGMDPSLIASATYTRLVPATAPVFAPNGGTHAGAAVVTLSCAAADASIRYTTDGSTPSTTVGTLIASGGKVTLNGNATLNAIAYNPDMLGSPVTSATYTVAALAPAFTPKAGGFIGTQAIKIASATPNASIRYTLDGTAPSATVGTALANGGTVTLSATSTLKAVAYRSGMATSPVLSGTYTGSAAAPTATPNGGTFPGDQAVVAKLATATAGAEIIYTLDSTAPSATNGIRVANGAAVTLPTANAVTIRAIAVKTGMADSVMLTTGSYERSSVAKPTASPNAGTFTGDQAVKVVLSSVTTGAAIIYTVDGTTPSATNGTRVANGATVTLPSGNAATIRAIAVKTGLADSAMLTTGTYARSSAAKPTASPNVGTYTGDQVVKVVLSSATTGAAIIYTVDATIPSATNGIRVANGATVTIPTGRDVRIRAIAVKTGLDDSVMLATGVYTRSSVVKPTASPNVGTYTGDQVVNVVLSSETAGATIIYTVDATIPSATNGIRVANGATVTIPTGRDVRIRAIAVKTGLDDSVMLATGVYTRSSVVKPTASPNSGTYTNTQVVNVVLSSETAGAAIIYTVDATIPSATNGIRVANGATVTIPTGRDVRIRAIAVKTGLADSAMLATGIYTRN